MTISNATQTFIFSVVDSNQEYNTKLILFLLTFLYLLLMLWISNKLIPFNATRDQVQDYPLYKQILTKLLKVFSGVFLFLFPIIFAIFMYREFDIDSMIRYLIIFYNISFMIGLGIFFLFGFNWVMDFLKLSGINIKDNKGKLIRRKD